MIKTTFIGAGSYGTAVANHFARKKQKEVIIYGRNRKIVDEINKEHSNSRYLGEHELSRNLKASNELQEAVSGADFLFIAVPAQEVRNITRLLKGVIRNNVNIINLAKEKINGRMK